MSNFHLDTNNIQSQQQIFYDAQDCFAQLQKSPDSSRNEDLMMTPDFIINPPQNDTVTMAILIAHNYLNPQTSTVRECLEKYIALKISEIDEISSTCNQAFVQRLNQMEDMIISGASVRAPANSEDC